ncbi:hypothetical protein Ocin01_04806 [Orchesella cincta]|uniref:Uncharacterized protein n=1 Tax=Orchesella cincta TaxID=48709 RepID=A0A1D2NA68_ORCCI|nr:hypothetical protein Ocin01_04806 [Orchesella cincta]
MAKRPCRDFDNATMLVTQLKKKHEFGIIWKLEDYSICSKLSEITSGMFSGGPKSYSWQFKMDTTKNDDSTSDDYDGYLDDDEYDDTESPIKATEVYLMLKELGDENDQRKINVQIKVSIVGRNNSGNLFWEKDVEKYDISFKDFSEKGVRLFKLRSGQLSSYIVNDALKIHCAITTFKGLKNVVVDAPSQQ